MTTTPQTELAEKRLEAKNSIDHMLRGVLHHHALLNQMADQKANILIGSLLVVLTIVLGNSSKDTVPSYILILSVGSVISLVFAFMSIMPRVQKQTDPKSPSFNPLFFGHFSQLSPDEYHRYMDEVMRSEETTYYVQIHNLYQLGSLLAKQKFYYLRLGYISLMLTLSIALIDFMRMLFF
jgi:hypothetical protein